MSIGIGAIANIIVKDDKTVMYEYGSYDLNNEMYRNENRICDGILTINVCCFKEPEIHKKIKKMPSGRKRLITKRIPISVDYSKMIEDRLIDIVNCSNCWKVNNSNIDVMVLRILPKLFELYQVEGTIPEHISYYI